MTINDFFNSANISCLLFLALLSFVKKNNTPIGYAFLSGMFIVIALVFVSELFEKTAFLAKYPTLTILLEPILFAFPPLSYLAVKHLTRIKKLHLAFTLHFTPYLLLLGLYLIAYFESSHNPGSRQEQVADRMLEVTLVCLFFSQTAAYLFASLRLLKKHRTGLVNFVSNIPGSDFRWLFNSIVGLCFLILILLLETILDQFEPPFLFSFLYLIGFYYIGVQLPQQKDVLEVSMKQISTLKEPETESETVLERKPVVSDQKLVFYKSQLLKVMQDEKPYLDPEMTLPKLSQMLALNTYQTSYIINTCFQENFYVFVNRYRLEACKEMLVEEKYHHLSILAIAFQAGFNSKTAFNTTFKKGTGLSPKSYRQQADKQQSKRSDLSVY